MPLPQFLALLALVIALAGLTIWAFVAKGAALAPLFLGALLAAGLARLWARVE